MSSGVSPVNHIEALDESLQFLLPVVKIEQISENLSVGGSILTHG